MMTLTNFPDRLQVFSFLLSFGILVTTLGSSIGWYFNGPVYLIVIAGILVTIIFVLLEMTRRKSTIRLYTFWNSLTKQYSFLLHWWVITVCFYIIFISVKMAGKDARFDQKSNERKSFWRARSTLDKNTYHSQYSENYSSNNIAKKWTSSFVRWSVATRNKWSLFLLPFLFLLKIHKVEEEKEFPANIYTLY